MTCAEADKLLDRRAQLGFARRAGECMQGRLLAWFGGVIALTGEDKRWQQGEGEQEDSTHGKDPE